MKGSAAEAKTAVPEGTTAQKWDDLVEITATAKSKYLAKGKTYKVHKLQAKDLIKRGIAKKVS